VIIELTVDMIIPPWIDRTKSNSLTIRDLLWCYATAEEREHMLEQYQDDIERVSKI